MATKSTKIKPNGPKPRYSPTQLIVSKDGEDVPARGARSLNALLSSMIREIGNEPIEGLGRDGKPIGWTRLEGVVRALYADAMSGKTAAAELLLERGWGKIPTPVEVDVRTQVQQMVVEMQLDQDTILNDPMLRELLEQSGIPVNLLPTHDVIEGHSSQSDSKAED